MADATYDVVVVGGGNKSLVTALYLAKYGGMEVAIFEDRHEIGGGISSEEGPAPGFIANTHSSIHFDGYYPTVFDDFPDFKDRGARYVHPKSAWGGVFEEDQASLLIYHEEFDPTQEKTAREIARFSKKDAETWLVLWDKWKKYLEPAFIKWLHTPPPPPGVPDPLEEAMRNPECGLEPQWAEMSSFQVLKDLFECPEIRITLYRVMHSWHLHSPDDYGMGLQNLLGSFIYTQCGFFIGGTHSIAHALFKCYVEQGGKVFTKCPVDKILVEGGKATGIRLEDGKEIKARKLVLSGVDPQQLCLKLLGEDKIPPRVARRVKNLEDTLTTITWYDYALHEPPDYLAKSFNPDIGECGWLVLSNRDEERLAKEHAWFKLGKYPRPGVTTMVICPHSIFDPTRAPEGKHLIKTETPCIPATCLTEREWLEFKKVQAEEELKEWRKFAPNMTWDNVIGYFPLTPYDAANLKNMYPNGNMGSNVDNSPGQLGRFRPTPDLARHKVPGISQLYATSAAWCPSLGGSGWQGYNCYKVIAEDLGLQKPWEEKGRPY